jgi:hypothetical protein
MNKTAMSKKTIVRAEDSALQPSIFNQPDGTDWFLAWLISLANGYGLEQGITLSVGGASVTGLLISGRDYFTEIGSVIEQGNFHGAAETLRPVLALAYSQWSQVYPKIDTGHAEPIERSTYIHLRRARIVTSDGKEMPPAGGLWRGKLSAVEGFMLGELGSLGV